MEKVFFASTISTIFIQLKKRDKNICDRVVVVIEVVVVRSRMGYPNERLRCGDSLCCYYFNIFINFDKFIFYEKIFFLKT